MGRLEVDIELTHFGYRTGEGTNFRKEPVINSRSSMLEHNPGAHINSLQMIW